MSVVIATSDTIQELRAELKLWEKTFAQAHHGRKPTRVEIRRDPTIAEKYRRFNRLGRPEEATQAKHTTPRKQNNGRTKQREILAEQTTNIATSKAQDDGVLEIAEEESEPTPAHIRCALGPTPQKDGLVLGIFDMFNGGTTPSKGDNTKYSTIEQPIIGTPSRALFLPPPSAMQFSRTPQSSSKRFYLEAFAGTPLKRKREDDTGTPASIKRQFATPSFLRRDTRFDTIMEEDNDDAHDLSTLLSKKPGGRKGMARSFSSILAGLRKNEDERMDEEWEILKELEAEDEARGSSTSPQATTKQPAAIPEESLAVEMPLGPDEAPVSDEDEAETHTSMTRKPWKKKGLKRQTKKTNMKPVLHAPQKAVILETQDEAESEPSQNAENEKADVDAKAGNASSKSDSLIRKTARKVNEAAHMNFRRLKIKSKNAKPTGRSGRFGRR